MKPRALGTVLACVLSLGSVIDLVHGHYWTAFICAFLASAWFSLDRDDWAA